jgi:hypothetical protein
MRKQLLEAGGTYLRAFIAAAIMAALASGVGILDLGAAGWRTVINAGLAAALVTAGNALNKRDTRYGIGAKSAPAKNKAIRRPV